MVAGPIRRPFENPNPKSKATQRCPTISRTSCEYRGGAEAAIQAEDAASPAREETKAKAYQERVFLEVAFEISQRNYARCQPFELCRAHFCFPCLRSLIVIASIL